MNCDNECAAPVLPAAWWWAADAGTATHTMHLRCRVEGWQLPLAILSGAPWLGDWAPRGPGALWCDVVEGTEVVWQ